MSRRTILFIDGGFLSKLSKYLGGENGYLKFDIIELSHLIAKKENLKLELIYYYTAPPFISNSPSIEERKRKESYDKFENKITKNKIIQLKEGRCQRLKENGEFVYNQKGVDNLLTIDLIEVSFKFPDIKNVILIACDTDFIPAINNAYTKGIKTILYTYFDRNRYSNFSRSNELLQNVEKYQLITREDFENSKLN
ncbi:MAG: NYN domain-containing protein [Nanoarchaeota archaeon]|nr:NYN domain-containing protein [Nanoarchaeota archaeon]